MALRIALVILTTTTISYLHIVQTLKDQSLSQLEKYVTERGSRERMTFRLAEDNHAILKREILQALDELGDEDPVQAFDALFSRGPDGVVRNRPERFDGTRQAGVYIDKDLPIDADIRRRVLTFYELCNRFGPAWHNRFQDTYVTTPENIMAIYWPQVPTWCQDAGPDLDMTAEEYVWVADVEHNPQRQTAWTGLFFDQVSKLWMVSCETPVDRGGRHIATVGHDIMLNELLERTLIDRLDGTYNMIFRDDGRLIAHPDWMEQIQAAEGYFDIKTQGDERLNCIVRAVEGKEGGAVILDSPENDAYLAVTLIEEPGWYFVTVYPKRIVSDQAAKTASFVLILGIASLLLEVAILFVVLRKQVSARLKRFLDATRQIADGRFDVQMEQGQDDELGRLAESFRTMAQAIETRDKQLASRRLQLEGEVAQRTEALENTMSELEEARRLAEAASHSKSEFLANMSHEIRTPMSAILGYAELIGTELADDPKQAYDAARTIQSNANHLLTIINDVLDVSKIEAGQMVIETIPTNPLAIAKEVVALLQPKAQGKGLELKIRLDTPVPLQILSDPTRLRQILLNLVGNAMKFTEDGGVTLAIACDVPNQELAFKVIDTGMGMTPDQCAAISRFEAFTQADTSTTRKFGGTGLGLRISYVLAKMLGGGLGIESQQGRGSTFTVTITTGNLKGTRLLGENDRALDEGADPADPAPPGADANNGTPLAGVRVLLAEDGLDNQRLIKHYLTKAGASVVVCGNGLIAAQALEAAGQAELPDVVFMDMQMPELDGYEATRRVRRAGVQAPIIALTAHAMSGDRQKCLDAGCDDYLTKPVSRGTLIDCTRSWAHRTSVFDA